MKIPVKNPEVMRRMEETFDLCDAAEDMKAMDLLRKNPEMTESDLRAALDSWRIHRPGAEMGDAPGRVAWERFPEWAPDSSKTR